MNEDNNLLWSNSKTFSRVHALLERCHYVSLHNYVRRSASCTDACVSRRRTDPPLAYSSGLQRWHLYNDSEERLDTTSVLTESR